MPIRQHPAVSEDHSGSEIELDRQLPTISDLAAIRIVMNAHGSRTVNA